MASYSCFETGPLQSWDQGSFTHPRTGKELPGKRFLREPLGLTSMEVSVNQLPPGVAVPFLHKHRENEELYLFLAGEGEFQVDEEVFPIMAGTGVRVSPAGARSYRNTGTEPLIFLVIQAKEGSLATGTVTDGQRAEGTLRWAVPPRS
jgi:mannose-6-phosphate isomerase-like protein (cupin superfamily)